MQVPFLGFLDKFLDHNVLQLIFCITNFCQSEPQKYKEVYLHFSTMKQIPIYLQVNLESYTIYFL